MKYVDEFRDIKLAKNLAGEIHRLAKGLGTESNFMEVCGTHTNTFFRFGLKSLLPKNIRLTAGPGCPVCVTDESYIDNAIELAKREDVIVTSFGDMLRVPGSKSSLYDEKAKGADVRIVYSTLEALEIARENKEKKTVFLGVGFETTSPTIALAVIEAERQGLKNFFVYTAHKLIPPAMKALIADKEVSLDGFILPAHVSAIIGSRAYSFLQRAGIPGVVAGFEPLDMLQGIYMLLRQIDEGTASVEIQYDRVVRRDGNTKAQSVLKKIFSVTDSNWRGLGVIPASGLKLRREYRNFDAVANFDLKDSAGRKKAGKGCLCGNILKGVNSPEDCRLFSKACKPEHPKGPCMVSSEGSCSVYYTYKRG